MTDIVQNMGDGEPFAAPGPLALHEFPGLGEAPLAPGELPGYRMF